jgi:restriction system protein
MVIPSFDQFIEPLLRLLAQHPEGLKTADVQQALADHFCLTDAQRRELLPSGIYPVYKSRIGWAHDRLKRAGLSQSERRGFWRLTESGRHFAMHYPRLDENAVKRLAHPTDVSRASSQQRDPAAAGDVSDEDAATLASAPDERLYQALTEIRQSTALDLLDRVFEREPEFFEILVLRLLKAMGYGADESSLEHSGSPGDDGIDGVISLDRLGLDQVYVQAKRWAPDRPIGKDAIHSFIGALHLKGATKGVFITTSGFTAGATRAGAEVRGLSLRLIDGERLAQLMIEYQVGVRHEPLPIPKIDLDFWESD